MPQGSILGLFQFSVDIIDVILEYGESNIASYADDATPHSPAADTQILISELQIISSKLIHWFEYNHLKANPRKMSFTFRFNNSY